MSREDFSEEQPGSATEVETESFRALVDDIGAILWEADTVTWRFTFVSHQAEALLGYPVEQWLGEPGFWVNLIHPEDRARAIEYCKERTEQGEDHEFEYRAIAADGRVDADAVSTSVRVAISSHRPGRRARFA